MDSIATSSGGALLEKDASLRSKAISIELRRVARTARIPRPVSSGGGGFRARRTDRFYRRFFIGSFVAFFVMPVILGAIYFFTIATNQYVSEVRFSVSSGQQNGLEALSSLASVLNAGQSNDGQIIAQYVKSRSIVAELEKTFNLRDMFHPGTWDVLAEARKDMSMEQFTDYWNGQVKLSVDQSSGLVTLQVRTFSPKDSLAMAQEITRISERMVNQLTRHNEENTLLEASRELNLSKERLEAAVAAMRDARIEAGVLDVDMTANSFSELLTQLYVELSKIETQIDTLKNNDTLRTPMLSSLQARADALHQQISTYENRVAGRPVNGEKDETLAALASVLADKQVDLTIAQNEYKLSVASYESARLVSERQRSYLMIYVQPSLAEDSVYPRRGLMWTAVIVLSFLFWALVAGIAMLVRDNTAA